MKSLDPFVSFQLSKYKENLIFLSTRLFAYMMLFDDYCLSSILNLLTLLPESCLLNVATLVPASISRVAIIRDKQSTFFPIFQILMICYDSKDLM